MSTSEISLWVKLVDDSRAIRIKLDTPHGGTQLIIMDLVEQIKNRYPQLKNVSLADIVIFGDSEEEYDNDYELRNITNCGTNAKTPLIIQYTVTKITSGIPLNSYCC